MSRRLHLHIHPPPLLSRRADVVVGVVAVGKYIAVLAVTLLFALLVLKQSDKEKCTLDIYFLLLSRSFVGQSIGFRLPPVHR